MEHVPQSLRRAAAGRFPSSPHVAWAVIAELIVGANLVSAFVDTDLRLPALVMALVAIVGLIALSLSLTVSDGSGRRGSGMLLAGVVGAPTGLGMAIGGLFGGLTLSAVVGLAAMAAGLALTAAGTVTLIRRTRGWRRLLALPIAFVLAQFVLVPVAAATGGTHASPRAFTAATPSGAEKVSVPGVNGVVLSAWYTPSHNGAALVLLHGAGGTKADTAAHAAVLARGGYGVLALDARGSGESGGHGMLWGWYGERDTRAAVDWLSARPEVDPSRIGAVGLSMGGEEAITAAAADDRIRAVVAEGASARTLDDVAYLPDSLTGWIERGCDWVMWTVAGSMTDATQPIRLADAVAGLGDRPLLLIVSGARSETDAAPLLMAKGSSHVQLWSIPDSPHTGGLATHPQEWEARVTAFLDSVL